MAVLDEDSSNTENAKIGVENYKNGLIPRITLASVESLTLPLVQEVVLLADFGCKGCQEKVAAMMSRMNGSNPRYPVKGTREIHLTKLKSVFVQPASKPVARRAHEQQMQSNIGETVSIEVSISEKKVTLTCIYPTSVKNSTQQVARIHKRHINKSSLIKRLFRSSCTKGLARPSPTTK